MTDPSLELALADLTRKVDVESLMRVTRIG